VARGTQSRLASAVSPRCTAKGKLTLILVLVVGIFLVYQKCISCQCRLWKIKNFAWADAIQTVIYLNQKEKPVALLAGNGL
jgi:hypothetical protein